MMASAYSYRVEGKFLFYAEMSACLPKLLKEDPRLAGLPHRAAQMTVQRLDQALRDCAKNKGSARRGFPKFKRYSDRSDAFSLVARECRVESGRIRLPRIGWLRAGGRWRSAGRPGGRTDGKLDGSTGGRLDAPEPRRSGNGSVVGAGCAATGLATCSRRAAAAPRVPSFRRGRFGLGHGAPAGAMPGLARPRFTRTRWTGRG